VHLIGHFHAYIRGLW